MVIVILPLKNGIWYFCCIAHPYSTFRASPGLKGHPTGHFDSAKHSALRGAWRARTFVPSACRTAELFTVFWLLLIFRTSAVCHRLMLRVWPYLLCWPLRHFHCAVQNKEGCHSCPRSWPSVGCWPLLGSHLRIWPPQLTAWITIRYYGM